VKLVEGGEKTVMAGNYAPDKIMFLPPDEAMQQECTSIFPKLYPSLPALMARGLDVLRYEAREGKKEAPLAVLFKGLKVAMVKSSVRTELESITCSAVYEDKGSGLKQTSSGFAF